VPVAQQELGLDARATVAGCRGGRRRRVMSARSDAPFGELEQLDQSERLGLLVDALEEYAVYLLGPDGSVISWNAGAERLKGYSRDEVLGRPVAIFYSGQDVASGKPQRDLERAAAEGVLIEDGWRVRKDGSRFWAHLVLTALHQDGQLSGFAKVTRDDTDARAVRATGQALHEITEAFLSGAAIDAVLELVAGHARALVDADSVWIGSLDDQGFLVRAATGDGPGVDTRFNDAGLSERVSALVEPVRLDDLPARYPHNLALRGFGPALLLPLRVGEEFRGGLVAARTIGGEAFQEADLGYLAVLAAHATVVLEHEGRQQVRRDEELSEQRQRIATNLHEEVIADLFDIQLEIQGAVLRMRDDPMVPRLQETVEQVDATIAKMRRAIFQLADPPGDPKLPPPRGPGSSTGAPGGR
jgi:PAS domain S-box-containing protein